jgi:glycosyltransferase involved in cell wall biosynthesis
MDVVHSITALNADQEVDVALLTGGGDRPYAFGLAMALISQGVRLDLIAGDELDSAEFHNSSSITFLNLRGAQQPDAGWLTKVSRVTIYYARLMRYVFSAKPRVFHILWNNKFEVFDRTVLMLWYKLLGKRVVLTVHNVNAGVRDETDSLLNRLTLAIQYRLADHIFVHTEKMKRELNEGFGVAEGVTVIPFGINNSVPTTHLTPADAKRRLNLRNDERTILFFGNIAPYKGLEYLVTAFWLLSARCGDYRLIVAGRPKGSTAYWNAIRETIDRDVNRARIILRIEFVPDKDTELYFKAADVLALPYTEIFQSGVLLLGYSFGLPVIASDVGSLREDIVEGFTGFLCEKRDPRALAEAIESYFASDLYRRLDVRRQEIVQHAKRRYSWDTVGQTTRRVYQELNVL